MQGVLVLIYQAKGVLVGWVDLNILFELISLVHVIMTEDKMSIQQILFTKKTKGTKIHEKIQKEEKLIYQAFRVL